MSVADIIAISRLVGRGKWTTYADVGELVYDHRKGGQTVGNVMRSHGSADRAHRILLAGGRISSGWRGDGGGPEECARRLRDEGIWDQARKRARPEGYLDADALRELNV